MGVSRPLGVTILAILEILGGIGLIGLGASLLSLSVYVKLIKAMISPKLPITAGLISVIITIMSVTLIITGLINFIIAYGLWKGKEWARILTIIFSILSILMGLFTLPLGIISIITGVIIMYYLTRSHVKAFFKATS